MSQLKDVAELTEVAENLFVLESTVLKCQ